MTDLDLRAGQIHRGLGVVARWTDIALVIPSDSSHDATVDKMFHDLGPSPTASQLVAAINALLADNKLQSVAMLVEATGGPLAMAFGPVEVLVDGQQVLNGSNGGVRQQTPLTANRLTIRATNLSKAAEPVAPYDLRRGIAPGAGLTLVTIPVATPPAPEGSKSDSGRPPTPGLSPLPRPGGQSHRPASPSHLAPVPKPQPKPEPEIAPEPEPEAEPEYVPIFADSGQKPAVNRKPKPEPQTPANDASSNGSSKADSEASADEAPLFQAPAREPQVAEPQVAEPDVEAPPVEEPQVAEVPPPVPQAERAEPALDPSPISVPFRSVVLLETAPPEPGTPLPLADAPKTGELSRAELDLGRVEVEGILCQRHHFNNPNTANCMVCGLSMLHLTHNLVKGPRPTLGFIVFDDGSTFGLDRSYLIGREPVANDDDTSELLVLHDNNETLSRTHAELRLVDWTVQLVDLESTNGTYIWDQSFSRWNQLAAGHAVELNSGDTIALGRRTFVFESVSQS